MPRPIAFMSDFGLDDEFVGVVHGVMRRIAPGVEIVDVSHGVERGNVRSGALTLLRAVQYLPPGVVVAVVDPGVGTARRAIAAETEWGHFVGPDNGLLAPAVAMLGGASRFVSIESEHFRLPQRGGTFDGRDVFGPAAAALASGEASIGDLGPDVPPDSITPLLLPLVKHEGGEVRGEVWWIDTFGNAQTNVSPDDMAQAGIKPGDEVALRVGAVSHGLVWASAYGEGEAPVVLEDSHGLMAVAVPRGRADEVLGLRDGLPVAFSPPSSTG